MNKGLQTLGAKEQVGKKEVNGASFAESALESIVLPSTLRVLECATFAECKNLRTVEFSEGLEVIGGAAFLTTGIENVTLPRSLREIHC